MPEGWTSSGQIRPQIFVDDQGRAWVYAIVNESSALWRFGPDGALEAERLFMGFGLQRIEQAWIDPNATSVLDSRESLELAPLGSRTAEHSQSGTFAWARQTEFTLRAAPNPWVLIDLNDLEELRFAYVDEDVPPRSSALGFGQDESGFLCLMDEPASFVWRAVEAVLWAPFPADQR